MSTITFSDGRLRPASYLVYFNGIEIPVQEVTVNFGVWEIPTAYIEIAPDPVMQRIGAGDRMQVAVFYLDDTYGSEFEFRLLFEGEITGWDAQNTPLGRRIGFRCVSHLRILNEIYINFITGIRDMALAAMSKDATQRWNWSVVSPIVDLWFYGLDLKQKDAVKRPFDILRNMLSVCLKKETQETYGTVVMKHFYAALNRRIDYVNRFVPSPIIEQMENDAVFPVLEALQAHHILNVLTNMAARYGSGASMWSVLCGMFTKMYYEILALPAPPIAQVRQPSGKVLGQPEWPDKKGSQPNRIFNFVTKPQWIYGIPPACNVIFPSMIKQFNFTEDYMLQPTRVIIDDQYWTNLFGVPKEAGPFDFRVAYPDRAQEEIDKILSSGVKGNLLETGRNYLVWPEEFFKGPVCEEETLPPLFHYLEEFRGTQVKTGEEAKDQTANFQKAQRAFAEYEYLRRRGKQRSGSVVVDFDPYFVPGFPTMIFDPTTFVHAYPLKVSHTLSQQVTNIEFTYAQTMRELLERVIEARGKDKMVDIAPVYPIESIRETMQVFDKADQYFSELLHQAGSYTGKKTAAFDFLSALMLVSPGKGDIALDYALDDPTLLDDYFDMGPAPSFEAQFRSPDHARNYVSRPVVTLEEYIKFHPRGIKKPDIGRGRVEALDSVQGRGAVFFEEILSFTQGPGPTPKYDDTKRAYLPVPPDTRTDWSSRLRNYRRRAILQLHGQE